MNRFSQMLLPLLVVPLAVAAAPQIKTQTTKRSQSIWEIKILPDEVTLKQFAAFSIYFDWEQYTNISINSAPTNWDSLAIQPSAALQSNGFIDVVRLNEPPVDQAISMQWVAELSTDNPNLQPESFRFTLNDPRDFSALYDGFTVAIPSAMPAVPEPGPLGLFAASTIMAWLLSNKTIRGQNA